MTDRTSSRTDPSDGGHLERGIIACELTVEQRSRLPSPVLAPSTLFARPYTASIDGSFFHVRTESRLHTSLQNSTALYTSFVSRHVHSTSRLHTSLQSLTFRDSKCVVFHARTWKCHSTCLLRAPCSYSKSCHVHTSSVERAWTWAYHFCCMDLVFDCWNGEDNQDTSHETCCGSRG